jgi:flagellar biosynthesis protein FliR
MEGPERMVLSFLLLLGRIGAFFSVLPIFSWQALPTRVRAGIAVLVTFFFAVLLPFRVPAMAAGSALGAAVVMLQEIACGLALGLAAHLVYLAAGQAGRIIALQSGASDAAIIDPSTGEEEEPLSVYYDMAFAVFFLVGGGHLVLLGVIGKSYQLFPVGATPDIASAAAVLVQAGSMMLLFGLKLAAPALAAFLILAIVLAVLSRAIPEMNILLTSLPLRMAMGMLLAAAILPSLHAFTTELADWLDHFLIG